MTVLIEEPHKKMAIDLDIVWNITGYRIKERGCTFVDYPTPRAKKLLKDIYQRADEETLLQIDVFANERKYKNPKLSEYWQKLRKGK